MSSEALARQASDLADSISVEWAGSLDGSGDIVNSVSKTVEGGYGRTMLAYGMLRADERDPRLGLLPMIERALPRFVGVDQAPFNLLALSETLLASAGRLEPVVTEALATAVLGVPISPALEGCAHQTGCFYYNKTLVNATGLLVALTALPGKGGPPLSSFADRERTYADVLRLLGRTIPDVEIADGTLTLAHTVRTGAILSDPAADPTAYLALSTMMLGRDLELTADRPASASVAFHRAVVALLGLTAPSGDISYLGRGQGQVWTFAAAAASCALAARLVHHDRFVSERCRGLIATELTALNRRRRYGGLGIATVPRASWVHGEGVDGYANATDYNGLTVYALDVAADALKGLPDAPSARIPGAETGERYLDPFASGLATTSRDGLWFAVHRRSTNPRDSRWGFGLMAAERLTARGWLDILTPRPLGPGSQGPILIRHGRRYEPFAVGIHVRAGHVRLVGGWSHGAKVTRRGVFEYSSTPRGVRLTMHVMRGDELLVHNWALAGQPVAVSLRAPGGHTTAARRGTRLGNDESSSVDVVSLTATARRAGIAEVLWPG